MLEGLGNIPTPLAQLFQRSLFFVKAGKMP